jgi:hypothetical protein
MGTFLFTLLVVGLLIFAGVVISVRLYTKGALGSGHLKRIRRLRSYKPVPGGTVVEETVEEVIEEEASI